jgi:hypothetical protein
MLVKRKTTDLENGSQMERVTAVESKPFLFIVIMKFLNEFVAIESGK